MVTSTTSNDSRIVATAAASLPFPRRVSWGAVFAGMVIAVVVQLLLGLLGTGIGMSTLDPLRQSSPDASTFGIGAGIWWTLSSPVNDLQAALQKIITSGKQTVDQADRDAVVNVVVAQAGVSRAEAEQRVDGWIKSYQDAKAESERRAAAAEAKARQVADDAASASSKAAFAAFVALILGALAAGIGSAKARGRSDLTASPRAAAFNA